VELFSSVAGGLTLASGFGCGIGDNGGCSSDQQNQINQTLEFGGSGGGMQASLAVHF
jgi:hypothetical protein